MGPSNDQDRNEVAPSAMVCQALTDLEIVIHMYADIDNIFYSEVNKSGKKFD